MKKRIRRKPKQIPSKSKLKRLYVKEGKSLREIGKIFATNPLRIRKILVGYGIKISKPSAWASGLTKETHDGIRRSAESKRGVPRDPETIKKVSIALTGRPSPKKGIPLSKTAYLHGMQSGGWFQKGQKNPNAGFKKGYPSPFKGQTKKTNPAIMKRSITATGKKRSAKTRKTMSKSRKVLYASGFEVWNKNKKGVMPPPWNKDKTGIYSEETIELIRQARLHQVFPAKDAKTTEIPLQKLLKENNIKFEKHKPILGQPDIFIEPNICIFADGDYWHANPKFYKSDSPILSSRGKKPAYKIWEKDEKINQKLIQKGYNILRLWEEEIKNNPEKCLQKIIKIIKESRR